MIISVGYRVKSKKGIAFRKWASSILKEYIEFYNKVRVNLKGTTPYQIRCNSLNY